MLVLSPKAVMHKTPHFTCALLAELWDILAALNLVLNLLTRAA